MNFRKQPLSLREAREMDLVNYLSRLGHEPTKIRNQDFWHPSPLREERWHEHRMEKGGNLIDFGIFYHPCTVADFLQQLSDGISFQHPPSLHLPVQQKLIKPNPENKITLVTDSPIISYPFLKHLSQRTIPIEIARQPCYEMRYKMSEDTYFKIGFKNDSNAWEIRSPYFKASSSPKGINPIRNKVDEVPAFERSMDFLSYKTAHSDLLESTQNYVTLNSVLFLGRARFFTEEHRSIGLYLDYDATEKSCTQQALTLSTKYRDESQPYKNKKDYNESLISIKNTANKD